MTTINELTEEQFKNLLDEYFAEPVKRSKMTDDEIKDLAKRLNEKIDVPLVTETGEEKILIKVVIKVDRFLYDYLPNEFYDLVRSLDKGIDDNEARRLIKRLSRLANRHIDLPYIPEPMEYVAIRFVLGIIVNSARKEWDMDRAKQHARTMIVPAPENANDRDLEAMVA